MDPGTVIAHPGGALAPWVGAFHFSDVFWWPRTNHIFFCQRTKAFFCALLQKKQNS
jgi:hypothetical protein